MFTVGGIDADAGPAAVEFRADLGTGPREVNGECPIEPLLGQVLARTVRLHLCREA